MTKAVEAVEIQRVVGSSCGTMKPSGPAGGSKLETCVPLPCASHTKDTSTWLHDPGGATGAITTIVKAYLLYGMLDSG